MNKIHMKILGGCLLTGLLAASPTEAAPLFRLPLSSDTAVHYYFDNNSGSGLDDWKCGSETYNGHRGTDFSGGPRGRAIFAGATGTLNQRINGFGDGYPGSPDGGGGGNYIQLGHGSGWTSWYFHMNINTPINVPIGSTITCGTQIGGVGTSGSSSGLHLHFEPRINGTGDDPYSGPCGGPLSYWVNQNNGHPTTTCQGGNPPSKTAVTRDNTAATFTGTWATGTSSTDKHGADYRYRSTAPVSEPATFTASLNISASWNVRAWWPQGSNRSSSAPYHVTHDGGTTVVNKNQQANGGSWQLLGTWQMSGTKDVKLSCWAATGYIVVADAVKWD